MSTILIVTADQTLNRQLQDSLLSVGETDVLFAERPALARPLLTGNRVRYMVLDCRGLAFEDELFDLLQWLDDDTSMDRPRILAVTDEGYPRKIWSLVDKMVVEHLTTPVDAPSIAEQIIKGKVGDGPWRNRVLERRTIRANGLKFSTSTPALFLTLEHLMQVAAHDVTLLITGETGTGKSYLANLVHELSARKSGPFFATACGALPRELIETELFGHVKGAFTSAVRASEGRFEAARGGTLLLDEIDVLGPKEQSKLLYVIETGKYEPVGSTETKTSDVRLIVASNMNLKQLAENHQFRMDLYYRLNVLEFHLPPLRERPYDIIPMAVSFLEDYCSKHNVHVDYMNAQFLNLLKQYHWPGNIRELTNQMQRAVLLSNDGILKPSSLSLEVEEGQSAPRNLGGDQTTGDSWDLNRRMAQSEREILVQTLKAHNNNRAATARALGISRTALYKKLHRFGLQETNNGKANGKANGSGNGQVNGQGNANASPSKSEDGQASETKPTSPEHRAGNK